MPVYQVIIGSGLIAQTVWTAARAAISLTLGRTRPEMTKPRSRERQWQQIGRSLVACILGIVLVTNSYHDAARWLIASTAAALLILQASSDIGSWRRSRRQRKSAQQQA